MKRTAILLMVALMIAVSSSNAFANNLVWKGPGTKRLVALTFDDGPKPEYSLMEKEISLANKEI